MNLCATWEKDDLVLEWVKLVPIQVLHHVQQLVQLTPSEYDQAVVGIAWLCFFFLLQLGVVSVFGDTSPLWFRDALLFISNTLLNPLSFSLQDLILTTTPV
jgi:hypothetical protein